MKKIVVIDSQRLSTMQACARKYHWSFDEDWSPSVKPVYFDQGSLIHEMLKAYYAMKKYRYNWTKNNKTHADIIDSCTKIGRRLGVRMQLSFDDLELAIKAIQDYLEFYANDGWDDILFFEETASKLMYDSDDLAILYEGKIDLGISIPNCPLLPVDHKSAKRRQEPDKMSNQFKGYCWLLDVQNIVINAVGMQKTLKSQDKFQRYTLSYDLDVLEEWKNEAIWWIKHMLALQEIDFFPMNNTSCNEFAGCLFRDICSSNLDTREWKLRARFDKRDTPWDVGGKL